MSSRESTLAVYRGILREVTKQYVKRNNNTYWAKQVTATFRLNAGQTDPTTIQKRRRDAENVLMYLRSNREYKDMMERYFPASTLTPQQKLEKTANVVGLTGPKVFIDGADRVIGAAAAPTRNT